MADKMSRLRVVDPVLTGVIQGFSNGEYVADKIFPIVDVEKEAGKIPVLTKEHFRLYNTKRASGANSNVVDLDLLEDPISYSLSEHDFGVPIDYRESGDSEIALETHAANVVAEVLMLRREKAIADLLQATANYTNSNWSSPTTKWNQASSTPLADLRGAIENVRARIGRKPNRVLIAANAYATLIDHNDFTDRIKYTTMGVVTPQMLASLLDVEEVIVGGAVYANDAMTSMTPVWNESVVIAHVTPGVRAQRNPLIPSFGYTLQKKGYPQADKYMKEGNKVGVVRGTYLEAELFHGNVAGYLLSNVLA